jgi:hypothetical protein
MCIMGMFTLCATVAIAVSMGADSATSAKSEHLLIQEGEGNLRRITKSPASAGGLQALASFTRRVVTMHFGNSTDSGDSAHKKASLHAAAAAKVHAAKHSKLVLHPVLHHGAESAHKRLAALALSKLQDEGDDAAASTDGDAANSTATGEEAAAGGDAAAPDEGEGSEDDEEKDDRYDQEAHPGWDNKGWTTSDWAVWTLTGPVLTMTATMFIFYTYGWAWALGTLVALVGVDMFGFYYNV